MTRAIIAEEKFVVQSLLPKGKAWIDTPPYPFSTLEGARSAARMNKPAAEKENLGIRYRIILRQVMETDIDYL